MGSNVMSAYTEVMSAQDDLPRLDTLANQILTVGGGVLNARYHYLLALNGDLDSLQGKTLPEAIFEKTGLLPVHLTQKVVRALATAQGLVSWAHMQQKSVLTRQKDMESWKPKYEEMWETNFHRLFSIGPCHWSSDNKLTLSCNSPVIPATLK